MACDVSPPSKYLMKLPLRQSAWRLCGGKRRASRPLCCCFGAREPHCLREAVHVHANPTCGMSANWPFADSLPPPLGHVNFWNVLKVHVPQIDPPGHPANWCFFIFYVDRLRSCAIVATGCLRRIPVHAKGKADSCADVLRAREPARLVRKGYVCSGSRLRHSRFALLVY